MVNYIGSDLIGTGTQVTMTSGEKYFLAKDVSIIAGAGTFSGVHGMYGADVGAITLDIFGTIYGNDGAIYIGPTISGSTTVGYNIVNIGQSGVVSSGAATYTLSLVGPKNVLTNAGEITGSGLQVVALRGAENAFFNSGSITSGSFQYGAVVMGGPMALLVNSGEISGYGIDYATIVFETLFAPPVGTFAYRGILKNSGIISSAYVAVEGSMESDKFSNTGTIFGDIKFGLDTGADVLFNSGLIEGRVSDFGSGSGKVINSGTITGKLTLGDGQDVVNNTGTLNHVKLGALDDTYIGTGGGYVSDRVDGGSGDDKLIGGTFDDVFKGDNGNDILRGNDGSDTLFGGGNDDLVYGGWGNDVLNGGGGIDELRGNQGDDDMDGGGGSDTLYGNGGDDDLRGGGGKDTLIGGRGDDSLTGGTKRDDFVFRGKSGNDTITDFEHGTDKIVLHGLGISTFVDLSASITQTGTDAVIDLTGFGLDAVILVQADGVLDAGDFSFV